MSSSDFERRQRLYQDMQMVRYLTDPDFSIRNAALEVVRRWPSERLNRAWRDARSKCVPAGWGMDLLERAAVRLDKRFESKTGRCVVTLATPGYEEMTRLSLEFLQKYGECDAEAVLFACGSVYPDALEWDVVKSGFVHLIPVRLLERANTLVKGLIYSLSRFVEAETVISIESDVFCVAPLQPLFDLVESSPAHLSAVLCLDNGHGNQTKASLEMTGGNFEALEWLAGRPLPFDLEYGCNAGVMAGKLSGWQKLDNELSAMGARLKAFCEGGCRVGFIDEIAVNIAFQNMAIQHLPRRYNVQFVSPDLSAWASGEHDPALIHLISASRPVALERIRKVKERSDLHLLGFPISS